MQFTVPRLRLGQTVEARLADINQDGSFIVDFNGDLLRVVNQSKTQFQLGEMIDLVVVSVKPLQFQLFSKSRSSTSTGINRLV